MQSLKQIISKPCHIFVIALLKGNGKVNIQHKWVGLNRQNKEEVGRGFSVNNYIKPCTIYWTKLK